jgi:carbonic anhydrase
MARPGEVVRTHQERGDSKWRTTQGIQPNATIPGRCVAAIPISTPFYTERWCGRSGGGGGRRRQAGRRERGHRIAPDHQATRGWPAVGRQPPLGHWAGPPPAPVDQAPRVLTQSQSPFAVVFSCIDSRVPPELVFDRGLGDIFVIRTGAQTVNDVTLGSVEFGPEETGTPLIIVLGHQRCGAVIAAIHAIQNHGHAPGHIQAVVDALKPAYNVAIHQSGDLVDNMVRAQTKLTVALLKSDPALAERVQAGELMIVGGRYSLETGRVEIIA